MSILDQQLKSIRTSRKHVPDYLAPKQLPSLLFEATEAKDIDDNTIFEIGINAIKNLIQFDKYFKKFQKDLFHESKRGFDRLRLSEKENLELNMLIKDFLDHLSQFFMFETAHQCLEYLIRIFKINHFNTEELVAFGFPFHQTKVFSRIIQLCNLEDSRWEFFAPIQKEGAIFDRNSLVNRCIKTPWLINYICELVKERVENGISFPVLVSFYTNVLIEIFTLLFSNDIKVSQDSINTILTTIIPYLTFGLNYAPNFHSNDEFQVATFMVIMKLSSLTQLSIEVTNTFIILITKWSLNQEKLKTKQTDALRCVIFLFQTQNSLLDFPKGSFDNLLKFDKLAKSIVKLNSQTHTQKCIHAILKEMCSRILSAQSSQELDENMNFLEEIVYNIDMTKHAETFANFLIKIYNEMPNSKSKPESEVNFQLGRSPSKSRSPSQKRKPTLLFEESGMDIESQIKPKQTDSSEQLKTLKIQKIQSLLRYLDQRYPSHVDKVLSTYIQESTSEEHKKQIFEFISLMFPEQHHYFDQNQNSTLFLLLNHSENSIRLIAIQNLVQIYSENKNHKESFANLFSDLLFQQLKQSIEFLCSKKDDAIANATKKWKNQSEIHSSFITYIFGLKDILFREDKEYYIDEYDENENENQNEKFQTLYEKFQTLSKLVFCNLNIEKQTELKSIALEIIGSYITPQKTDFEMEIILLILSNILFTSSELENEISRMAVKIAAESKYALFSGFEKLVAAQNKKLENKEITKQHNLDIVETLAQNIFLNWNQIDSLIKFNSEYSVAMLILEVALVQAIKISSGKEKEKEKEKEIKYYLISKLNNLLSSHLDEMRQEHLRNPKNTREENQTQVKYLGNTPEEIIEEVSKKSASDSRKIICYCYSQILDSLDPKTQETQQQIRLTFQHLISFEKYFDQFLIHLFKQFPKLMETKVLQFIGSFIIGNSESKFDNESGNKIEINVQINSLKMASAIMLALSSKFNDFYHYIPNTLCLLNSNHKLLKKAGFSFAKSLLDILKKKTKKMSSYFMYSFKKMHNMGKESTSFLKMLIKNKTELIANTAENALSNFIQNHATEGIIDLCIFHLGQFQSSLAQFLLISCFNEKKLGSRMKDLFPLMKRLFEKTKNQDSNSENQNPLTFFEWKILDYLLSCLSNSPLKQLFESDNEMFQFYLELIKCPLSQSFEIKNENDNENEKKKKVFSVQKSAISLVGSFYEQIEESYQYQILLSLIETKAVSTNPEISNLIQETIDKIGISSKFASKLLSIPETLKGYSEKDSPQKRRHLLKKETNEDNEEQFLSRIIHTLELLKSIENEEDKQNYLACLLDTLEFFLDSENPLSKHSSSEYIQQLILLVVRNISEDISSKSHSQNIEVAKNQISKINLLVKCIQISDNPQTHNLALIALCSVAKIFPREVLKDIINIFVFIGTKILKREDNYTFAIVKRTIKMIIPVVMKEGSINPESILDVFIENFNHIPSQQQLHLFVSLLESMNIDSGLSIVVKKLFTISTNQFKLSSKNNSDHPLVLFAQNLCTQFEPKIQIISFIEVLKNKIEKHQKEEKKSKFNQKKQIHQNYLNFIEWTTILDFISKSIRTNIFLEQLITISNSKEKYKEIQDLYVKLFEHLLISLTTIKINYSNSTKYKEIKKASEEHSKLVDLINEIFHGLNKLLSVQSFFQIILDLIKKPKNDETSPQKSKYRNDMEINQQILLMFNEKVDSQHLSFSHEDVLFLMGMVKDFIPFLKEKTTKENIVNQQMIVFNIDTLCNYFGDQDTSTFSEVFPVVLELIERNTKNKQIVPSGLMCLATISKTVKTMVLEYLPRYFPLIFKSIYFLINYKGRVDIKNGKENININIKENQKNSPINDPKSNEMQMEIENSKSKQADKKTNRELEERNLLAISGLTSLQEVLNNFPNFASPHLQKVLTALLHPRILKSKNENIYSLVTQIFMIMAEKIQAQHIIAPILKTFKFATVSGTESLCYLFDLLKNVCLQTDFKTAREYDKELLKFFLASFDLRNNLDAIGSLEIDNQKIDEKADIDLIEKHLITAFLSLVLKLNESHFKPIFLKILHWASSDSLAKQDSPRDTENQTISEKEDEDEIEVSMSKHLVLFKISKELILKLKSIFVPYLEYLVDISCLILEKTKKISAKYIQLQNATIINIIDFLHQCFLYDSDGIIGKEKFDRFLEPLVDQLDSQMESEEKPIFEKRVNSHLIPCLGQLVVTSSDDIFWKSLTHQVLLKSRSQDPVVRLAVIKTIYEFYDRLGEEYVTLLPESISFIAELMEDSNIHVEKQCQKLISKIETYLGGESIKKYLI